MRLLCFFASAMYASRFKNLIKEYTDKFIKSECFISCEKLADNLFCVLIEGDCVDCSIKYSVLGGLFPCEDLEYHTREEFNEREEDLRSHMSVSFDKLLFYNILVCIKSKLDLEICKLWHPKQITAIRDNSCCMVSVFSYSIHKWFLSCTSGYESFIDFETLKSNVRDNVIVAKVEGKSNTSYLLYQSGVFLYDYGKCKLNNEMLLDSYRELKELSLGTEAEYQMWIVFNFIYSQYYSQESV